MSDKIEDVVKGTIFPRLDKLYSGINDLREAQISLDALGELKTILENFKAQMSKNDLDQATYEALDSQYRNAEKLMDRLERFFNDFKQMKTPEFTVVDAKKHVSNLHLVFNGLCDIAKEVDRNYVKKPHLLCGNFPECSCCQKRREETKGE
jgi:inorganic pyrophosphatase